MCVIWHQEQWIKQEFKFLFQNEKGEVGSRELRAWLVGGQDDSAVKQEAELRLLLCVSLNGQYIMCFLDHLSHITVQCYSFNF